MINLMYLVFIAMLAMNMSKEVLTAFGNIKENLETSIEEITTDNNQFLSGLEVKASENPDKFGPLLDKAKKVKSISATYANYLEELKADMIKDI